MFEREKPMQSGPDWKCCGCGALTPDRVRACECATSCLYREIEGQMEHHVKTEVELYPCPNGIGRVHDNERALIIYFESPPSDEQMRGVLDALKESQRG